jgi:hypothetical protein
MHFQVQQEANKCLCASAFWFFLLGLFPLEMCNVNFFEQKMCGKCSTILVVKTKTTTGGKQQFVCTLTL